MSDFERYRARNMRNKALENLYQVTKRVFNLPANAIQSDRIRLLADLQGAIEMVEAHPVPKTEEPG